MQISDTKRSHPRQDDSLSERTPLLPDGVAELLNICLRSTYFSYGGEFYKQREGAAMDFPVSAEVANLYMEFFLENWLLSQHPPGPGCGSGMWMTHTASLGKVIWMGSYFT